MTLGVSNVSAIHLLSLRHNHDETVTLYVACCRCRVLLRTELGERWSGLRAMRSELGHNVRSRALRAAGYRHTLARLEVWRVQEHW